MHAIKGVTRRGAKKRPDRASHGETSETAEDLAPHPNSNPQERRWTHVTVRPRWAGMAKRPDLSGRSRPPVRGYNPSGRNCMFLQRIAQSLLLLVGERGLQDRSLVLAEIGQHLVEGYLAQQDEQR